MTALGIGVYQVGVDRVAEYSPYWATLLARAPGVCLLGTIAATVAQGDLRATATYLLPLLAIGLLDTSANAMWAAATVEGLLSVVAVLGAVFPAFTVLLALVVLREPLEFRPGPRHRDDPHGLCADHRRITRARGKAGPCQ